MNILSKTDPRNLPPYTYFCKCEECKEGFSGGKRDRYCGLCLQKEKEKEITYDI